MQFGHENWEDRFPVSVSKKKIERLARERFGSLDNLSLAMGRSRNYLGVTLPSGTINYTRLCELAKVLGVDEKELRAEQSDWDY